ncbi:MAG: hypothetical protein J6B54_01020 [Clostridia bacterium]|nr:hypothetical protein [Clostridia bacterium]
MKQLFYEFFHISSQEKIREKVFLARAAVTVGVTVFCLFSMGISAFAYFSHDIVSGANVIRAATFGATVKVSDPNGDSVEPTRSGAYYVAELKGETEYVVTLQYSESTAKTGFVIISADGCDKTYHTQQLGKDETVTLYLKASADTKVRFLPHWGTSSFYGYPEENNPYYLLDETHTEIPIQPPSASNPASDGEENGTDLSDSQSQTSSTDASSVTTDTDADSVSDSASQSTDSTPQSTNPASQSTNSEPQSDDSTQQSTGSEPQSTDSAPQPSDTEEPEPTE